MKNVKILGVKVTSADMHEIHTAISRFVAVNGQNFILSGNIHGINLAVKYAWLRDFYNRADLIRVDGAGVVIGARFLGDRIKSRNTWADWGWHLAEYLSEKGHSVFLLGGPEGVAEKAAERLKEHAGGIKIAGIHHGYFEKSGRENSTVIDIINQNNPDILIVGMGMPLQEKWILENHRAITANVFITAGAAFEYLAGTLQRCPKWVGDRGLEWLYRLLQNPRRMAGRYILGNTLFFINVLMERSRLRKF